MDQEGTYKWIQDRLRDLYSGKLSDEDRMRMNEIAKTDPFVADALEGFEAHAHHDHTTHLNDISHRIRGKRIRQRRMLIPSTRGWLVQAVAACLVLLIATWAVLQMTNDAKNNVLATQTEASKSESPQDGSSDQSVIKGDEVAATEESIETTSDQSGLRGTAQSQAKKYLESPEQERTTANADEPLVTGAEIKEKNAYTFSEATPPPVAPSSGIATHDDVAEEYNATTDMMEDSDTRKLSRDQGYYANQMSPEMMSRRVVGRVTDVRGEPLIGATLNIQNTNLGTTSDIGGRFELFLPARESNVDVTYSGFVDASLTLKQGEEDVVIMLPDQTQSTQSVVVMEAKTNKAIENVPAGRSYSSTRPKTDHTSYTDYLRNNTRIPLQENAALPGKEVTVEFDVNSKGRPDNIRIVRSFDAAHSEEAVRLIRKGPDWDCEMDLYPCIAQYTIYFR